MPVQINFELSDNDLEHFRALMKDALAKATQYSSEEIITKAKEVCDEMSQATLPDFVAERLDCLKTLIAALEDPEWQMPEDEKTEVLTSLAYFTEPHDLVPDHIPGLGYVDDAIMIELVIQDLSQDLDAYNRFCEFRRIEENRRGDQANVNREVWIDATRKEIRSGFRRRRKEGKRRRIFG
ncbi:YkvA family protein [Glaciecola sp. 1036]|uniref:YkvA family protein n=1 Tax=Alteromonadaceae TaxID=72275 RepID=UPI003D006D22